MTVLKRGLPATLRRSLATTNCIENLIGSIRKVTRNVKRWRGGFMIRRWVGLAVAHAQKRFRKIKGYRDLPALVLTLSSDGLNNVDQATAVA